jgi:heparin binding hemagglutinin HbhA
MTLVSDIRKTVIDTTPVYAAVGVTDLAVEKVRDARDRAVAVRAEFHVSALQGRAAKRAEQVAEQAQHIPAIALSQTLEAAGKAHTSYTEAAGRAQATYTELAVRGEKLVKRIRADKATNDLLAQAGSTVALGKSAVTTIRKSGAAVRLAPKRTAPVAKKRTTAAKRATKAAASSAATTATKATQAVKAATPKVGDSPTA